MRLRHVLLFTFASAFIFSCSTDPKKTENGNEKPSATETARPALDPRMIEAEQYTLAPGRAGKIAINMLTDSLKKLIPAANLNPVQRELEGEKYTAFELRNVKAGNQLLLLAEESCQQKPCKIFRVRVISPKFKTKEGIRVGSRFGDIKKLYPLSYVGLGETDFVALSETQRMAFCLDISKFPSKPLYKIKQEDVPDSAFVTSILMF